MKRIFLAGTIALSTTSFSQTLQEAITKTENERYELAGSEFRQLIKKDANNGDYYFYAGENYFNNDNTDSALVMYKKGSEVQPTNGLNFIGMGKVQLLQDKTQDGNANLFKGKTLGAKNNTVLMKLSEAYTNAPANAKNLPEAIKTLNDIIKKEPKNSEAHILLGDALLEQNPSDGSPAIKEYEEALKLNPKSPKALLREGKLYARGRNYNLAVEYYKKAITVDPTFAPAYRELAEIYSQANQPSRSIENWKKYLELNNSNDARYRFMGSLFKNKQYQDAINEYENLKKSGFKNPYLERIAAYSYYENGNKTDTAAYTKGMSAINDFFNTTNASDFRYIPDDYKYKGLLLSKTGKDSLGAEAIMQAVNIDPVKNCDLNGDVAKIYMKMKRYEKAIAAYDKKSACVKGLSGQDYYDLGRAYFFGPKDFVKSDTAFSKLTQLSPTYPLGYFWRGKANVQLDPKNDKFLAKPYYEKGIELVKPEERGNSTYKNYVIEAASYLGYYYVVKKDYTKAKEFWNIVKELDPTNKKANDFFKSEAGK